MAKIAALGQVLPIGPDRQVELERPRGPVKQPRWVPIAIAASLLFAIAGASFLYFKADQDNATTAHQPNRPPSGTQDGPEDLRPFDSARPPSAPMPAERNGSNGAHEAPPPAVVPEKAVAVAPEPRTPDRDLIGAHPRGELPNFDLVQLRLPFLEPLAEFDRDAVRQQLIEELGSEPAFRIDLFARNSHRGVELFQKAARASGLVVHADNTSMSQLRKGQASSLVIYTDSLTANELTALIARLNSEDAKVSPRVFDAVHATPIAREDESEIRRVLGTDPGLFKRPAVAPDRRKEIPKGGSVSAGTADQIVDAIKAGKGRAVGGSAILMTLGSVAGSHASGRLCGVEDLPGQTRRTEARCCSRDHCHPSGQRLDRNPLEFAKPRPRRDAQPSRSWRFQVSARPG